MPLMLPLVTFVVGAGCVVIVITGIETPAGSPPPPPSESPHAKNARENIMIKITERFLLIWRERRTENGERRTAF